MCNTTQLGYCRQSYTLQIKYTLYGKILRTIDNITQFGKSYSLSIKCTIYEKILQIMENTTQFGQYQQSYSLWIKCTVYGKNTMNYGEY